MEGLRRKLGRWLSFGCGGFEIHGGKHADSAGEWEELTLRSWRREGEGERTERERARKWARVGGGEVLAFNASSGDGQGRARRSARGSDRRTSVLEWLKQGRCGPSTAPSGLSVRLDVTIFPPKRNLVPRFRVKLLIEMEAKS